MAEISVIIPVYNVERYVAQCLDSVLAQTVEDMEILIVDDGSRDGSSEICRQYAGRDSRIRLIRKENGGLMSAWMAGLEAATGRYIGFVDSDDWLDEDFFGALYRTAEQTQADIVVGQFVTETDPPTVLYRSRDAVYEGREQVMELANGLLTVYSQRDNRITWNRCDKLYKARLLRDNVRFFDRRISLGEDVNTLWAVLPDAERVVVLCDTPKYHYRARASSIVHQYNDREIVNIAVLHRTLLDIAAAKGLRTEGVAVRIGTMVYEHLRRTCGQPDVARAVKRRQIRQIYAGMPRGTLYRLAENWRSPFVLLMAVFASLGAAAPLLWLDGLDRQKTSSDR